MYKAVKLEAFCNFAEKHGNIKGNVLKYAHQATERIP